MYNTRSAQQLCCSVLSTSYLEIMIPCGKSHSNPFQTSRRPISPPPSAAFPSVLLSLQSTSSLSLRHQLRIYLLSAYSSLLPALLGNRDFLLAPAASPCQVPKLLEISCAQQYAYCLEFHRLRSRWEVRMHSQCEHLAECNSAMEYF